MVGRVRVRRRLAQACGQTIRTFERNRHLKIPQLVRRELLQRRYQRSPTSPPLRSASIRDRRRSQTWKSPSQPATAPSRSRPLIIDTPMPSLIRRARRVARGPRRRSPPAVTQRARPRALRALVEAGSARSNSTWTISEPGGHEQESGRSRIEPARINGTMHVIKWLRERRHRWRRRFSSPATCAATRPASVQVGDVTIGGGNPIVVQSMAATRTQDIEATVRQVKLLEAGRRGPGARRGRLAQGR